ncbi:bifunctional UDP-N-acetylglucosamine diphosphorylase/glucosamine-1-phosphate N-acetyltransferase GlmU, partial [Streptococcus thermophilus]|nr:bifunctional UDP-N-acetylglucosamine diphosphorylase/glucosamine-1-phosphate N-acetyltransferase GlmU [Streptococcus thermophilus]
QHMENGVSIINPDDTYIDAGVKIGADTIIEPGVLIKGHTTIGEDCFIGAHSEIHDMVIEDRVRVTASFLEDSIMHADSNIGPYSHLRPQAEIGEHVHLGNFVEVKK